MITLAAKRLKYTSIRLFIFVSITLIVGLCLIFCVTSHCLRQYQQDYAGAVHQAHRMQTAAALLSVEFLSSYARIATNDKKGLAGALNLLNQQANAIQSLLANKEQPNDAFKRHNGFNGEMGWVRLATSVDSVVQQLANLERQSRSNSASGDANLLRSVMNSDVSEALFDNLKDSVANLERTGNETYMNLVWLTRASAFVNWIHGLFMGLAIIAFGFLLYGRLIKRRNEVLTFVQTFGRIDDASVRPAAADDEFGEIELGLNSFAAAASEKHFAVLKERETAVKTLAERSRILERTNEGLRDTGKAFIRFLTDISHDLRTPLAIIRGESEIVLKADVRPISEYRGALGRVVEQTDYLSSLVDHLLYTARSRVASTSLEPESFDLVQLVDIACDDMTTLANKKSIELVRRGTSGRQTVFGDRVRLREMLLSVIDNAVNYSNVGSTIRVEIGRADNHLRLSVSDSGIGISSEDLPNIFKRFYRAQNAISINSGGTGIGLAVAKGIVESHGGTIDISSELGRGTTVTVDLPAVDAWQKKEEVS